MTEPARNVSPSGDESTAEPVVKPSTARSQKRREREALGLRRLVIEDVPDDLLAEAWNLGLIEAKALPGSKVFNPRELGKFVTDCIGLCIRRARYTERQRAAKALERRTHAPRCRE